MQKNGEILYGASALLIIAFIIKLVRDYIVYKTTLNSAPFYLWVLVDSIYFLVPAIIFALIGYILKKKRSK